MRHRSAIVVLLLLVAASMQAQSPALNPTVTVLPQATAPVPADCETTQTQPPPQIAHPVPLPAPAPPPVARPLPVPAPQPVEVPQVAADVRSVLREAHDEALSRDRAAFDGALARAKAMGGATAADRDVIAVLTDVQRLWDYQFTNPSGAFFDASAEGGALLAALKRYPGYDRAIEPHTITVSGTRYYPVRESILFLLDAARERLQRTGVRMDRVAEQTPRPAPPSVERPRPQPQPQPQSKPAASTTSKQPRRTTAPPSRPRTAARPPAPQPVTDDPALPIPSGVVSTTAPAVTQPAPVDQLPPTTPETATTATTTTVAPLDTIEPLPPDTAAAGEEPAPRRGRSILMPLVLILIGIGVLIVLFRASS